MLTNMTKTLFLHGGPGLSAAVERIWFGNTLPVDWWDQPAIPAGTSDPFMFLVQAAERRLCTLSHPGTPVNLLAHSFGARLAVELARRHPSRIARITLMAGTIDLTAVFLTLGRLMASQPCASNELSRFLGSPDDKPDCQTVRGLIESLLQIPGLFDQLWAPKSGALRERFNAIAAKTLRFDTGTLLAVAEQSVVENLMPAPVSYSGPVRLLLGQHDPLLAITQHTAHWQAIFPRLQLDICDAGHNLHFELPASQWL